MLKVISDSVSEAYWTKTTLSGAGSPPDGVQTMAASGWCIIRSLSGASVKRSQTESAEYSSGSTASRATS